LSGAGLRLQVLAAAALAALAAMACGADGDNPADAVLSRYVEASGGMARLQAIRERVSESSMQSGWFKLAVKTVQEWPDRVLMEARMPLTGSVVTSGYDGQVAWAADKGGPRRLAGRELQEFVLHQRLDQIVRLSELYPSRRLLPADGAADPAVRKVVLGTSFGTEETWSFSVQSGLLAATEGLRDEGPSKGVVDVTTRLDDYRTVDGVTLPFRAAIRDGSSELNVVVNKLELSTQPGPPIAAPDTLKAP
jgi:hypothetical protein